MPFRRPGAEPRPAGHLRVPRLHPSLGLGHPRGSGYVQVRRRPTASPGPSRPSPCGVGSIGTRRCAIAGDVGAKTPGDFAYSGITGNSSANCASASWWWRRGASGCGGGPDETPRREALAISCRGRARETYSLEDQEPHANRLNGIAAEKRRWDRRLIVAKNRVG